MTTVIPYRFLVRAGTAAAVAALNEIPKSRELIFETDTKKFKLGNGVTAYNSLPYVGDGQWQPLHAFLTRIAAMGDPGADRLMFWDDSAGQFEYLTLGTNLAITGTTLDASTGGGTLAFTLPVEWDRHWGRGSWMRYVLSPNSSSSGILTIGFPATIQAAQGTGAAAAYAATNAFTRQTRYQYTSSAAAGNAASVYNTVGYACGDGGYFLSQRWGWADAAAVANARGFVGLRAATSAPANADPSSFVNMVGFGCDTGDTNLQFMHNDGSGTATKVDLGSSFPANTISTDFYETQLLCEDGSGIVNYHIRNVTTGSTATGSVNTNIPAGSTVLAITAWRNNGTTALAVRLHDGGWVHGPSLEG